MACLARTLDYDNFKSKIGRTPAQKTKLNAYHEILECDGRAAAVKAQLRHRLPDSYLSRSLRSSSATMLLIGAAKSAASAAVAMFIWLRRSARAFRENAVCDAREPAASAT